jgi:hypothetical protein
MLIQLNENLRVTGIPMNFVLEEKKVRSDKSDNAGEEYWSVAGYYPDLESLLRRMLQRAVEQSECEGIQNIINEINLSTTAIVAQIRLLECEGCKP